MGEVSKFAEGDMLKPLGVRELGEIDGVKKMSILIDFIRAVTLIAQIFTKIGVDEAGAGRWDYSTAKQVQKAEERA